LSVVFEITVFEIAMIDFLKIAAEKKETRKETNLTFFEVNAWRLSKHKRAMRA